VEKTLRLEPGKLFGLRQADGVMGGISRAKSGKMMVRCCFLQFFLGWVLFLA
jgi:hypothetical protein